MQQGESSGQVTLKYVLSFEIAHFSVNFSLVILHQRDLIFVAACQCKLLKIEGLGQTIKH